MEKLNVIDAIGREQHLRQQRRVVWWVPSVVGGRRLRVGEPITRVRLTRVLRVLANVAKSFVVVNYLACAHLLNKDTNRELQNKVSIKMNETEY